MFQTCAFTLDQSLHLLFSSPGQRDHLGFSDKHKSMWDETIFFLLFKKIEMNVQTETNKKRNQRKKNQQFQNRINTHNSTINNQNPGTLHHECHRPRRDDRSKRRWGTSRKRSAGELDSRGNWQKTGKPKKENTEWDWWRVTTEWEEISEAEGKGLLQTSWLINMITQKVPAAVFL